MADANPINFHEAIRVRAGFGDHVDVFVSSRVGYCGCCRKRIRSGTPFYCDTIIAEMIGGNPKLCVPCLKFAAEALPKAK